MRQGRQGWSQPGEGTVLYVSVVSVLFQDDAVTFQVIR